MPTFEYDDYIEPVDVKIGGETYHAMPAVPATMTAEFMDLFGKVPPLIARLTAKDPDDDGVDESKLTDEEKTARALAKAAELDALPEEQRDAKTEATKARTEDKLAAYREFIETSIEGLTFVLLDEDAAKLMERASSKERPLKPVLLATIFSQLAGYYLSGGSESEKKLGSGPTDDGSASLPSSEATGGTSEESSSPELDSPNSEPGTPTT